MTTTSIIMNSASSIVYDNIIKLTIDDDQYSDIGKNKKRETKETNDDFINRVNGKLANQIEVLFKVEIEQITEELVKLSLKKYDTYEKLNAVFIGFPHQLAENHMDLYAFLMTKIQIHEHKYVELLELFLNEMKPLNMINMDRIHYRTGFLVMDFLFYLWDQQLSELFTGIF